MSFDTFKSAPSDCTKCDLHLNRTQVVFPDVFCNSEDDLTIVVIGEAPGAKEDELGKPFVGASGKILRKELAKLPGRIIITNTVKCRPPDNRNPKAPEKKACNDFLKIELDHYKPDLIILVGRVSSSLYLDNKTLKDFSNISGTLFQDKIIPILHPASTMYNGKKNKPIWEASWINVAKIIQEKFSLVAPRSLQEAPDMASIAKTTKKNKSLGSLEKFMQD